MGTMLEVTRGEGGGLLKNKVLKLLCRPTYVLYDVFESSCSYIKVGILFEVVKTQDTC